MAKIQKCHELQKCDFKNLRSRIKGFAMNGTQPAEFVRDIYNIYDRLLDDSRPAGDGGL